MRYALLYLALAFLTFSSCKRDGDGNGDGDRGWEDTEIRMNNRIQTAHASDNELLLISNTEFFRIGQSLNILEKRPVNDLIYGRPILSDFVYAYMKKDGNFKDMVSFHLVNNPDEVVEIHSNDLVSESGQTVIFETQTRTPGVFNEDGTQFVIPALVFPDFNYHFFIFDIELNAQKTQIEDISLAKEVTAVEMIAEFGSLTNLRFIDGLFYASAYTGGYRFNDAFDEAEQLFPHWTIDFFKQDSSYYATGLFFHDFFISETGEHWQRMWHESSLNNVEMVDGDLFSHNALGWQYKFVEDLREGSDIFYPESYPENNTLYNDIVKFGGNYYMTIDNELHTMGSEVPLLEE